MRIHWRASTASRAWPTGVTSTRPRAFFSTASLAITVKEFRVCEAIKGVVISVAATLAVLSPQFVSAALRASYEVSLSDNGKTHSIRTVETLSDEQPTLQELGPFKVEMLPTIEASGAYSLQVTVTRKASSPSAVALPLTRSFPGALGGPLEFSAQFGDVQASGAIMLRKVVE